MSENLAKDGYSEVVSIDISDVVIQKMKERAEAKNLDLTCKPNLDMVMDATAMSFADKQFDLVIEKGGF